jgi:hypothetical protein
LPHRRQGDVQPVGFGPVRATGRDPFKDGGQGEGISVRTGACEQDHQVAQRGRRHAVGAGPAPDRQRLPIASERLFGGTVPTSQGNVGGPGDRFEERNASGGCSVDGDLEGLQRTVGLILGQGLAQGVGRERDGGRCSGAPSQLARILGQTGTASSVAEEARGDANPDIM